MNTNIDYLELINSYLSVHPNRQQEYFKFLHDNQSSDPNHLSYRFCGLSIYKPTVRVLKLFRDK